MNDEKAMKHISRLWTRHANTSLDGRITLEVIHHRVMVNMHQKQVSQTRGRLAVARKRHVLLKFPQPLSDLCDLEALFAAIAAGRGAPPATSK
jgi:hypothetical protein